MITVNRIAITTKDTVLVISQKEADGELLTEVEDGLGVDVEVELGDDEGAGVGLRGTFAGTDIVWELLQLLVTPVKTRLTIGGIPS